MPRELGTWDLLREKRGLGLLIVTKPPVGGVGAVRWEASACLSRAVTWRALLISDTRYSPLPWGQGLWEKPHWGQSQGQEHQAEAGKKPQKMTLV